MADKSNKLYDYDKILTNIAITNAQLTIKLDTINAEHQTNKRGIIAVISATRLSRELERFYI